MEAFFTIGMLIFAISLILMGIGNLLSLKQQNQNQNPQPQQFIIRVPMPVDNQQGGEDDYDDEAAQYPAYMDDPDYEPVTPITVTRGKPDLRIVK